MAHAEISQYSVMAHYLEAVPKTRFCVDTTRGSGEQTLNAAQKKLIMLVIKQ